MLIISMLVVIPHFLCHFRAGVFDLWPREFVQNVDRWPRRGWNGNFGYYEWCIEYHRRFGANAQKTRYEAI